MSDSSLIESTESSLSHKDPINAQILAVSEDRIAGFHRNPLGEIARLSQVPVAMVIERIQNMLRGGTIRRVRQTLMATDLASGALVAWNVPEETLDASFEDMFKNDPFSGHVVVRSTDTPESAGARYRLWTTLKVPQGYSLAKHAEYLRKRVGAHSFRLMPAKGIFALGVGHTRRQQIEPGAKSEKPAEMHTVKLTTLTALEWKALLALKREFTPEELSENLWDARAAEAGLSTDEFCAMADDLNQRQVIGRFSTFLEHVKPTATGERVTKFNALFHWAVPAGRELEAGKEIGRHFILTHCYWREGGPEFKMVNIMAVAHGTDRNLVRTHKAAIDAHLEAIGMPYSYTNVFWGGRSEIKPSEIAPSAYEEWCLQNGINPNDMKA